MSEPFPILTVPTETRRNVEQLGSKQKFWFVHENHNWLFKVARENTGEDWAEKIGSEIGSLLRLQTHSTELAEWKGLRGCAVKSFLAGNTTVLVHGNELLGGVIENYDKDKVRGQSDHTFDNIIIAIERVFRDEKSRREASYSMIGYLVLDALIGNTDRHHQNWGLIMTWTTEKVDPPFFSFRLSPTFDHASSLGRELTDEARIRRLKENSVAVYVQKGRGGIFLDSTSPRGLSPIAVVEMLANRYPAFFKPWQNRVAELSVKTLASLLDRVPNARMTDAARQFALQLLCESRGLILKMP